jgi:aerobic carbon-monoxide dehydrogenase medium subunit
MGGTVKAAPFVCHFPATVGEVLDLLTEHGDGARVLAGGQSLVPALAARRARVSHLIDLNRIAGLSGVSREDGWLRVGPMTRQRVVERDASVRAAAPLLARAAALSGPVQIRNRGTVGGSLAHADPAAELPAVALALDAELEHTGPLLTGVRFPVRRAGSGFGIEKVAFGSVGFAVAGAVVALDPGRCRIVLYGAPPGPRRAAAAEDAALAGAPADDVAREAVRDLDPPDGLHACAATVRHLTFHAVVRALTAAREESNA